MQTKPGTAMATQPERIGNAPIRTATAGDTDRCLQVLTRAFESDAPCRWLWPDIHPYRAAFPRFARVFGGSAIELGTANAFEGFSGVAFWLPPGTAMDEASLVGVIQQTVTPDRVEAAFSVFEQMDHYHPREAHWHLPLIGVDPAAQGRGVGSALLRHALEQCDRERAPAYLEATSPRNIALYKRHGFEVLGSIEVSDCPPIVPMLRRPR